MLGFGRPRFDIGGSVSFAVAMVSLVLAVTWIGDPARAAASVVCFAVAGMAFAAFFLLELRALEPLRRCRSSPGGPVRRPRCGRP
jgi:hypothetical protein